MEEMPLAGGRLLWIPNLAVRGGETASSTVRPAIHDRIELEAPLLRKNYAA
jgi:hypothetical protein